MDNMAAVNEMDGSRDACQIVGLGKYAKGRME